MDKDGLSSMILKLRNILDFFPTKCLMSKHQVIIMSPGFHSLYMPLSQWSNVKFICNIQSLSIFPPTLHYLSFSQHCAKLQNESFYLSTFLLHSLMFTFCPISPLLANLSLAFYFISPPFSHFYLFSNFLFSSSLHWTLPFSVILINPKSDWLNHSQMIDWTTVRLTETQSDWQSHSQTVRLIEPWSDWQNHWTTCRTMVWLTDHQSDWVKMTFAIVN